MIHYEVFWEGSFNDSNSKIVPAEVLTTDLDNLVTCRAYSTTVRAVNGAGEGPPSDPVTVEINNAGECNNYHCQFEKKHKS